MIHAQAGDNTCIEGQLQHKREKNISENVCFLNNFERIFERGKSVKSEGFILYFQKYLSLNFHNFGIDKMKTKLV